MPSIIYYNKKWNDNTYNTYTYILILIFVYYIAN